MILHIDNKTPGYVWLHTVEIDQSTRTPNQPACWPAVTIELLASLLQGTGLSAQVTHNRTDRNERFAIIQEFNEGRCQALITCRIGLSGISLQGVNIVILHIPSEGWDDVLVAVHKAGLAQDGKAYLILDRDKKPEVERFQAISLTQAHPQRAATAKPPTTPNPLYFSKRFIILRLH